MLDKARLWDSFKAELEAEVSRGVVAETVKTPKSGIIDDGRWAQRVLDRMLRSETLAEHKEATS